MTIRFGYTAIENNKRQERYLFLYRDMNKYIIIIEDADKKRPTSGLL